MFLCYIKKSCITADYSNLEFGLFPSKIKPNPLSKQNSKITILICFFGYIRGSRRGRGVDGN